MVCNIMEIEKEIERIKISYIVGYLEEQDIFLFDNPMSKQDLLEIYNLLLFKEEIKKSLTN